MSIFIIDIMNKFYLKEEEKKRILSLYNKNQNYISIIKEEYSGEKAQGYNGDINKCKKDTPINVVSKAGLNWNNVKKVWGSKGNINDNIKLRDAFCEGWRPDQKSTQPNIQNNSEKPKTDLPSDGVRESTFGDTCINVTTTGSFDALSADNPENLENFMNKFMQEIKNNTLLNNSLSKGTLYVGSINLIGGASNIFNSVATSYELENNYSPTNNPKGDSGKAYEDNKNLAKQRAQNLFNQLLKIFPENNIKISSDIKPILGSVVINTGGKPDNTRDKNKFKNPGQIVKCSVDLCGVEGMEPKKEEEKKDKESVEIKTVSIAKEEVKGCFKDAKIEVNYTGKGHKCNYAVYEIYANGVKINRNDGKDYASLNNDGDEFDNKKSEDGDPEHRFNTFIIDQITADKFVNYNNLITYQGNLQLDAKCVLRNPNLSAGWAKKGGCHDGVGNIKVNANGKEFEKKSKTPNLYGESINIAYFPVCKEEYNTYLTALQSQKQNQT